MRKSRAGKYKMIYIILNFRTLDFIVRTINELKFQILFVIVYPVFLYTYLDDILTEHKPGKSHWTHSTELVLQFLHKEVSNLEHVWNNEHRVRSGSNVP